MAAKYAMNPYWEETKDDDGDGGDDSLRML